MRKIWKLKYSESARARFESEAEMIADEYYSGRKLRRRGPFLAELTGEEFWPANAAGQMVHDLYLFEKDSEELNPCRSVKLHYDRKFVKI